MNAANTVNAGAKIARLYKLLLSLDSSGYEDLLNSFKDRIREAKTLKEKRIIQREVKEPIIKLEAKIELLNDLKRDNF